MFCHVRTEVVLLPFHFFLIEALRLLSHQHKKVQDSREKGTSEAGVRLRRPIDSLANTS